jgi:hypothetical protein
VARRGRGASALPTSNSASNGLNGLSSGAFAADEPGARTIGALALRRWAARDLGNGAGIADRGVETPVHGPYDADDLDPQHADLPRIDFGAVHIPVLRGGRVTVEPEEGRLQAVHMLLPAGRLSVSALAAPRTGRLWPDLAAEIDSRCARAARRCARSPASGDGSCTHARARHRRCSSAWTGRAGCSTGWPPAPPRRLANWTPR